MLPVNDAEEIQKRVQALKSEQEFASVEKIYRVAEQLLRLNADPDSDSKEDKAEPDRLKSEFDALKQCINQPTFQAAKEKLLKTLEGTFDRYDPNHTALKELLTAAQRTCQAAIAQAEQLNLGSHQQALESESRKLPTPALASHLLPQIAGAFENIDAHTRVVAAFATCCSITENLLAQKLDPDGDLTRDVDGMHKAQELARENNQQSLQEQAFRLEDSAQKVQTRLDKPPQPSPNGPRLGSNEDD